MKKTVLFIALAAGSLTLAACQKKAEEAPATTEATAEATADASAAADASGAADASAATSEAAK